MTHRHDCGEELWHLLQFLLQHRKEFEMSEIQFTVTVTVNPAVPPLSEGSSSGAATFTQGVQSSVILTPITGGVPPYSASVDAASPNPLPPGVTAGIDANNNLILSGTPSASGGPLPTLLDVVDALGSQVASVKTA
jgi:hypothetical protein